MTKAGGDPTVSASGVLVNLLKIKTQKKLDAEEFKFSTLRIYELGELPVDPNADFDLARMMKIHQHIFQDVYSWAGEIRNIDISKGGDRFAHNGMIESAAAGLFKKLKAANNLKGLSKDDFADQLAYFFNEVNVIHPFREGNGRASRVFFNQLAAQSNYQIGFASINRKEWIEANKYGFSHDHSKIRDLFANAILDFKPNPKAAFLVDSIQKRVQECRIEKTARISVKAKGPSPSEI